MSFLLGNWRWLLPTLAIGAALAWGGIEHSWRVALQRDAAQEVAQAQAMVAAFQEKDAERTRAIEDAHAAEVARLRGEANARETSIMRAVASRECLATPAARAFIGSLPGSAGQAGAGDAPGAGRAGPGVPAPAAAARLR